MTDRLALLSELTRLRLLRLLERQELGVGELARVVQMPQSTVSRHLKMLLDARWILRRAAGTAGRYRMVVDDLEPEAADLWQLARRQLGRPPQIQQDDNRLDEVLRQRRTDTVAYFGRLGGEWDAVRAELFGRLFDGPAILGLLPRDWVVADLGCGTGNLAARLAPHVGQVIAVDMSEPMLQAARKRLGDSDTVDLRQGDLRQLPIETGVVDAVVMSLVLHHIEDPPAALAESVRILKPGGRLLIIDMLEHDRADYRLAMGHHWLGFAPGQIETWLAEADVRDVRLWRLGADPEAKGPDLFAVVGSALPNRGSATS